MRALALALVVLASGCVEDMGYEPLPEPSSAEEADGALSMVSASCRYSFDATWSIQVQTSFDVALPETTNVRVTYALADDPSHALAVSHSCEEWAPLEAGDGTTIGCHRDASGVGEQILAAHLTSASVPVNEGMQLVAVARISDTHDAVLRSDAHAITCVRD